MLASGSNTLYLLSWYLICVGFILDVFINENWENDDSYTASSVYFPTLLGLDKGLKYREKRYANRAGERDVLLVYRALKAIYTLAN